MCVYIYIYIYIYRQRCSFQPPLHRFQSGTSTQRKEERNKKSGERTCLKKASIFLTNIDHGLIGAVGGGGSEGRTNRQGKEGKAL